MRIVFADPPQKEKYYDISYPNLGILYLISSLRSNFKDNLEILYLEGHCTLKKHLEIIKDFKPDLYGISFALWTTEVAYRTINQVKKTFPSLPVICGGAMPTVIPDEILNKTQADICVLGEGEGTIVDIVRHFRDKDGKISDIKGIAYREKDGKITITDKRPFKDINSIPIPAWDVVDFKKYSGMHLNKKSPQTLMLVSRGCPYDCNFCANPVWKYNKPWVRMRSPEDIVEEIKLLYGRGIREIYMTSDEFNITEKWAVNVCEAIFKLNYKDLFFQCNIRADVMTEKLAKEFKKINMWMVHLGIESGNQKTLDNIGKKITIEQINRACEIIKDVGIKTFGFVMLYHVWEENGDLKWEAPADVDNTIAFCKRLLSKKLIDYMSWQVSTAMPGSRLWNIAKKHNLLPDKHIDSFWAHNLLLPGITSKDVKKSIRKGMLIKNYYLVKNGNINLRHLDRVWRNVKAFLSP